MSNKKQTHNSVNFSEATKNAADEGRVVKRNDRMVVDIIEDGGAYKKGMRVRPHRVYGEQLVAKKIGKEVTADMLEKEATAKKAELKKAEKKATKTEDK